MRIILDTNVILSALITQGLSSRILDLCIDQHNLFISQFIIDEVKDKLKSKFNITPKNIKKVLTFITSSFIIASPKGTIPDACRDKDDNNILLLSDFINADLIITGDKDLLSLKRYKHAIIITPRDYMEKYHNSY